MKKGLSQGVCLTPHLTVSCSQPGVLLNGQTLMQLAQLVPTDEPMIAKFIDSLRVEIKEREVKVSITLPGELIAQEECCPEEAKRLSPGMGSLTINAIPWAVVYVDGKKVGNTPLLRIKLKAGRHEVTLDSKAQGIRKKLMIVIQAGKETKVMKMLKKK